MKILALPISLLFIGITFCWPAGARVINIPADEPTIQSGIFAAVDGDTVLVADGTYNEHIWFLGRAITLTSVNGPEFTTIDGGGYYQVVRFSDSEGLDSVISGFTITNGEVGIKCLGDDHNDQSSATIRDNIITGNETRGIYCEYSAALIEQNRIYGNTEGGIHIKSTDVIIDRNEITNNGSRGSRAHSGGGIYSTSTNPHITRNTITGNVGSYGGGINITLGSPLGSPPRVTGNLISGNTATHDGGGMSIRTAAETKFQDNVIIDNAAGDQGGGVHSNGTLHYYFSGNLVSGNTADAGGGFYNVDAPVTISNNLFLNNTAQNNGGGLLLGGCEIDLMNNTVVQNDAMDTHGGGIYASNAQLTLTDNILFFNTARFNISKEIRYSGDGAIELSYCDVEGGQASVSVEDPADLTWGPGMIDADPLLVDGSYGQACLSQTTSGQPTDSPCLDAGSGLAALIGHDSVSGAVFMDQMTTRTDQLHDSGTVDLGWHNRGWPSNTVDAALAADPVSGILPFGTQLSVDLRNRYLAQSRRVAARIDVDLASGAHYTSWRAGWTNVDAGGTFTTSWGQYFPALGTLVGMNRFELTAVDVTPAPFNQPPYPPAGQTDQAVCAVTAEAP